jgi:hypothetical protein
MTNRDRKGVAEIERVTGARVRHFTADQVMRGEELKVLAPAAATPEKAPAEADAAAPERVAAPPAEHARTNGAATRIGSKAGNGFAGNGAASADGQPIARLFVNAGKRHGVTREALAEAFAATGIEPQRVRMHHTYGLVDVPRERADEAVAAMTGSELAGRTLNVELAREQPAAA